MCNTDDDISFPTADTAPSEVVDAQLRALRALDIPQIFTLFSRARRRIFEDHGRAQSCPPPRDVLYQRVFEALETSCPGLIGHSSASILSALYLKENRDDGLMPRWCCRVQIAPGDRTYTFTLTRQHDPPPPAIEATTPTLAQDPRNAGRFDGFEGCWLVWSIEPDGDGGSRVSPSKTPQAV